LAAADGMTYNRPMPANLLIPALVSSLLDVVQPAPAGPPLPGPAQLAAPGGVGRLLPAAAKKGQLTPGPGGVVLIDGNVIPLSVAAQIRNESNLIVQPSSLRQSVAVRYQTDATGALFRAWILSPAELAGP
jgi:hypothetical protein